MSQDRLAYTRMLIAFLLGIPHCLSSFVSFHILASDELEPRLFVLEGGHHPPRLAASTTQELTELSQSPGQLKCLEEEIHLSQNQARHWMFSMSAALGASSSD